MMIWIAWNCSKCIFLELIMLFCRFFFKVKEQPFVFFLKKLMMGLCVADFGENHVFILSICYLIN